MSSNTWPIWPRNRAAYFRQGGFGESCSLDPILYLLRRESALELPERGHPSALIMSEPSAQENTLPLPKRPLALLPLAGLLTAPGAEGAVVLTRNPLTVSLSFATSNGGEGANFAWDIDGDSHSEASTILTNSSTVIDGYLRLKAGMGIRAVNTVNGTVQPVGPTEMVGSSNLFLEGGAHDFSQTDGLALYLGDFRLLAHSGEVARDYVGFRFERSGATHYGVAELSLGIDSANNDALYFTIHQWAWESDPDTAISASALIPEPGTPALAVLALGSLARRRRRSA